MIPVANERLNEIKEVHWEEVEVMLEITNENIKCFYDRGVQDAPEYKKGDLVWLDAKNIK